MLATGQTEISTLSAEVFADRLGELADLLHACVTAGASISFVQPFGIGDSEAFWRRKVKPGLADGSRLLFVARHEGLLAGSVQLNLDTPPNQPHRAEVNKLIVHPDCRRLGIARSLMLALEEEARARGRSLITLDTRTGDKAEPLYTALGYRTAGIIPGFSRDVASDRLDATTIMYKQI
ncbi:GNAT family N-acetyltransferase [Oceanibaculum nanhaiense]|uniref:GNAT family N-acetyltransferase n=1 Tax=Oceanibaculum nanhaiense TaxID=1909734 RepID=UPI00396D081B